MPRAARQTVAKSKAPVKSKSNTSAKAKPGTKKTAAGPVFFYEPDESSKGAFLSPWYRSHFEVKGVDYISVGQYILAEKARAFDDQDSLQKVLEAETPEDLIDLGSNIHGVDEQSWRRRVTRIAKTANLHKFTSDNAESRNLLKQLKKLGDRELVFADPSDNVLGIGISAAEAEEVDRADWGANVFGKSLNAVKDIAKATIVNTAKEKTQKQSGGTFTIIERDGELYTSGR